MNRKLLVVLASLLLAGLSALEASASCIRMTPAQQRARADFVFDAVALNGPTSTGVQRFRVTRYLKARGPEVVRVNTANARRADGTGAVTSVSLIVRKGERWRIYARGSAQQVLLTTVCDGSRKL